VGQGAFPSRVKVTKFARIVSYLVLSVYFAVSRVEAAPLRIAFIDLNEQSGKLEYLRHSLFPAVKTTLREQYEFQEVSPPEVESARIRLNRSKILATDAHRLAYPMLFHSCESMGADVLIFGRYFETPVTHEIRMTTAVFRADQGRLQFFPDVVIDLNASMFNKLEMLAAELAGELKQVTVHHRSRPKKKMFVRSDASIITQLLPAPGKKKNKDERFFRLLGQSLAHKYHSNLQALEIVARPDSQGELLSFVKAELSKADLVIWPGTNARTCMQHAQFPGPYCIAARRTERGMKKALEAFESRLSALQFGVEVQGYALSEPVTVEVNGSGAPVSGGDERLILPVLLSPAQPIEVHLPGHESAAHNPCRVAQHEGYVSLRAVVLRLYCESYRNTILVDIPYWTFAEQRLATTSGKEIVVNGPGLRQFEDSVNLAQDYKIQFVDQEFQNRYCNEISRSESPQSSGRENFRIKCSRIQRSTLRWSLGVAAQVGNSTGDVVRIGEAFPATAFNPGIGASITYARSGLLGPALSIGGTISFHYGRANIPVEMFSDAYSSPTQFRSAVYGAYGTISYEKTMFKVLGIRPAVGLGVAIQNISRPGVAQVVQQIIPALRMDLVLVYPVAGRVNLTPGAVAEYYIGTTALSHFIYGFHVGVEYGFS